MVDYPVPHQNKYISHRSLGYPVSPIFVATPNVLGCWFPLFSFSVSHIIPSQSALEKARSHIPQHRLNLTFGPPKNDNSQTVWKVIFGSGITMLIHFCGSVLKIAGV